MDISAQGCLLKNLISVKDLDIAIRKAVAAVGPQEEWTCRMNHPSKRIQEVNFMPDTTRKWVCPSLVLCIILWSLLGLLPEIAFAGDVACRFKATETTEIHVLADGKTLWAGSIEQQQTKTVSVPEGPFTVISKVYNQNLKAKEDVRAEAHTRQCRDAAALAVPLFQDFKER